MTDRITLIGLRAIGYHGVFAQERRDGQPFVVDLRLDLDLRAAAASDDVTRTVHYGELAEQVVAVVTGEPVDLIETLATRICEVCFGFALVDAVEVTVHKPDAPITVPFDDVAVTLVRSRA